ncbi:MAG: hypothetical protein AAF661_05095 [Pseudomonadota bacterium]
MNNSQKIVDAMARALAAQRSEYHLTLGQLIHQLSALTEAQKDLPVVTAEGLGIERPRSYRGYYEDLAFCPSEPRTGSEVLSSAESALGSTYEGYKGGNYVMTAKTSLWVSDWGNASGIAIVGLEVLDDKILLVTRDTNADEEPTG